MCIQGYVQPEGLVRIRLRENLKFKIHNCCVEKCNFKFCQCTLSTESSLAPGDFHALYY